MEKYTIGEVKKDKINQFEVIIVADSNDADYITTREFYDEDVFDDWVIYDLITLLRDHSEPYKLEGFNGDIYIPHSDWGVCHSLETVEVNYYDNNGSVRPVIVNKEYKTGEEQ